MGKVSIKIATIGKVEEGTTKAGKSWKKLVFTGDTDSEYDSLHAFEIFQGEGKDSLDKFLEFNKVGYSVDVSYNVKCREHNGKYYTNLSAWDVRKSEGGGESKESFPDAGGAANDSDIDLPF